MGRQANENRPEGLPKEGRCGMRLVCEMWSRCVCWTDWGRGLSNVHKEDKVGSVGDPRPDSRID
jgi:hypothetical protein